MSAHVFGDWGTSRLRLTAVAADGAPGRQTEGLGIGALLGQGQAAVTDALAAALEAVGAAADTRVTLCGMAGARGGLIEVPYVACPADAATWSVAAGRTEVAGRAVTVAAGLRADGLTGAPDVMRGEETQIFGAVRLAPALDTGRHALVLPGTHSKWVLMDGGVVQTFQTFPTGELFALLGGSTLLRAAAAPAPAPDDPHAADGFDAGLRRGRDGAGLAASLFEARAAQLLEGRTPAWASAYLSGLLIADEVRTGLTIAGAPPAVTLIGDPALGARYTRALRAVGVAVITLPGDACARAGLERLAAVA